MCGSTAAVQQDKQKPLQAGLALNLNSEVHPLEDEGSRCWPLLRDEPGAARPGAGAQGPADDRVSIFAPDSIGHVRRCAETLDGRGPDGGARSCSPAGLWR
jgi:hypothetical protein